MYRQPLAIIEVYMHVSTITSNRGLHACIIYIHARHYIKTAGHI